MPVSSWLWGHSHGHPLPPISPDLHRLLLHRVGVLQLFVPHHLFDRKFYPMKIKHLLALLLLPVTLLVNAAPFTISADGQEVTDAKTGLIWRRCAEGMTASGDNCVGFATTFNVVHEVALTLATSQANRTGMAWRLPNLKELSSIADKSRRNPAIDPVAFPATPAMYFWSSSPYVGSTIYAWVVSFYDGTVNGNERGSNAPYVRLVRGGQ